jgi:hypothetical protein
MRSGTESSEGFRGQCRQRPCGDRPRGLLFANNLRLVSDGKSTPCSFFENKTESILVKN